MFVQKILVKNDFGKIFFVILVLKNLVKTIFFIKNFFVKLFHKKSCQKTESHRRSGKKFPAM